MPVSSMTATQTIYTLTWRSVANMGKFILLVHHHKYTSTNQLDSPHGYGHNGIGAVMSQVAGSPSDPVFFMHHGFVDHSWYLWQNADTANRNTQINGCSDSANPCTPLTGDYVLSSQGLRPAVTVNDVLNTQGGYLCYVYDS